MSERTSDVAVLGVGVSGPAIPETPGRVNRTGIVLDFSGSPEVFKVHHFLEILVLGLVDDNIIMTSHKLYGNKRRRVSVPASNFV